MVRDDKGGVIIEIYVVLVGTKHSGNIGAVARTCSNFNVKNLILVNPLCEIDDHAYERATKGRFYLDNAIIVSDIKEIDNYVDLKIALSARIGGYNNLSRSSIPITTLAEDISNNNGRIGLVFGREDYGLSNDEVNHCDVLTYIPLPSENQVLNISHAASLSLWEIMRKSSMKSFAEKDGDSYILNGTKNWITNGLTSDIIMLMIPTTKGIGYKGISCFIIEDGMKGFTRGRKENKLGIRGSETCEIYLIILLLTIFLLIVTIISNSLIYTSSMFIGADDNLYIKSLPLLA